jgi:glycosyltransferase involved in cell wall biosynthesis
MPLALSIIVCTYNRAALIADCLNALLAQTLEKTQYEILVIDNNSKDQTKEIVTGIANNNPIVTYFREENQGLSFTRNRGWREARGQYIAFIDDDARASADWCERLIHIFTNVKPTPVAAGGKILPWYEAKPPRWFHERFETRTWGDKADWLPERKLKTGFSGSNMAFPKDILQKYGGFNTSYGMQGDAIRMSEDTEFFFRMSRNGETCFWYDPDLKVSHWTPPRNFTLKYRYRRSYEGGRARARIHEHRLGIRRYCSTLMSETTSHCKLIIPLPFWVAFSQEYVQKSAELLFQHAYSLGYLLGSSVVRRRK